MVATPTTLIPKDENGNIAPIGSDGTNWQLFSVNSNGVQKAFIESSEKAMYAAGTAAFTLAASATDIFELLGSASKTVKLLRLELSGVQTAAGIVTVNLIKRGAADSGGTAVNATIVPLDSSNAAGTAVARHYTANPTINNTVGNIVARKVLIPAAASVASNINNLLFDALAFGQPIVLRGAAESLAINLGGVTVTGGSAHVSALWTEE